MVLPDKRTTSLFKLRNSHYIIITQRILPRPSMELRVKCTVLSLVKNTWLKNGRETPVVVCWKTPAVCLVFVWYYLMLLNSLLKFCLITLKMCSKRFKAN